MAEYYTVPAYSDWFGGGAKSISRNAEVLDIRPRFILLLPLKLSLSVGFLKDSLQFLALILSRWLVLFFHQIFSMKFFSFLFQL